MRPLHKLLRHRILSLRCSLWTSTGVLCLATLQACTPTAPASMVASDRFVKKQADGKAIGLLDGPWACVEDKKTGLHWEVKAANENPQFNYSSYSWKVGDMGGDNGGSCGDDRPGHAWVEYTRCDTQDLIDHVNQKRLCGYQDWRLPSALELRSVMFQHAYPGERQMLFTLMPRIVHSPYWTADHRQADGMLQALTVHAANGGEFWVSPRNVANAMLVRGPALSSPVVEPSK